VSHHQKLRMLRLVSLSMLGGALAQTYGAVEANAGCTAGVGCKGYYRAFVATTLPLLSTFGPPSNVTGIALAAVGVQAQTDGTISNGRVDIAGLKFKTPADDSDGPNHRALSFYFGYLGISGVFDNRTNTAAVAGALCEVSTAISSIQVYYDRDGVPGFQWDLTSGVDIFNCATGTYDCVDFNGKIDMERLTWTPISRTVDKCVDKIPGQGYVENCTIHTLTTAGQLNGTNVFTLNIRTASQPLRINGLLHSPDKAKWDARIDYPWSIITNISNASIAKIALVKVHAGKAVAAGGVATVNSGTVTKSLTFTAAGGKQAYYGYTTTVTIDGADSTVVTQTITNTQIKEGTGAGLTAVLVGYLQLVVGWLELNLWVPRITVHSFTVSHPNSIFWDPEVGVMSTSPAMIAVPSVLLALLAFVH